MLKLELLIVKKHEADWRHMTFVRKKMLTHCAKPLVQMIVSIMEDV